MISGFIRRNGALGWFAVSLFLLIVGFSLYYVRLAGLENVIILHFTAGQGADVLGGKDDALAMLGTGAMILVMNSILAAILTRRNRALGSAVSMLTAVIILLILIAILGIIAVN